MRGAESKVVLVGCFALGIAACGAEADDVPAPGTNCGFERDAAFSFTAVELVAAGSSESCPMVTPEEVNGAEEPDCMRSLEECELVLTCSFRAEGVIVNGRGRLELLEDGELGGVMDVVSPLRCSYEVRVRLLDETTPDGGAL